MDAVPRLLPIVLDPITIKHKSATDSRPVDYTCAGEGLLRLGHTFLPNLSPFIPPVDPTKTKAGKPRVYPVRTPKKPVEWWRAQCAFRGLPSAGKVGELIERLRAKPQAPMEKVFQLLQEETNREFKIRNAEARDNPWDFLYKENEKAEVNPRRFLEETFFDKQKNDVVVRVEGSFYKLREYAETFGLFTANMILGHSVTLAIGRNSSEVNEIIKKIKHDCNYEGLIQAAKQVQERDRLQQKQWAERARREKLLKEELAKKQRERVQKEIRESKCWNVTGKWEISCPKLVEQYGDQCEHLTMEIYREQTAKGIQMYAKFNLAILEGFFRFEKEPRTGKKSATKAVKEEAKPTQSYDHDYEEDERRSRSPTPEAFYLDSTTNKPSVKHPTWNYRGRWRETGEGEIDITADEQAFQITFGAPKGTTLRGTLGTTYFNECEFTGVKIDVAGSEKIDIAEEWAELSKGTWNRECVSRWH